MDLTNEDKTIARIVCIGEGMLELSRVRSVGSAGKNNWCLGYGGDVVNTAIHLSRAGHDVAVMTALGADAFSTELRNKWQAEGLDCSTVLTHPRRQAGLYAISLDNKGERSFTYWRETSAAREMFALDETEAIIEQAAKADLLYFSLITLAILPVEGRQRLFDLAAKVRGNGGKVAFDGNYRPRLWNSVDETIAARDAALALSDIGLPTFDDEHALSGDADADAVAAHWMGLGCIETIVKLGAGGARLPDGTIVTPEEVLAPVDTSGAGDAFNGGYLTARMNGIDLVEAALVGHAVAGWTIMRPGAIPPREA